MFCTKCGKANEGNPEFCTHCGAQYGTQGAVTSPSKPKKKEMAIAEIAKYIVLAILIGAILKALNII